MLKSLYKISFVSAGNIINSLLNLTFLAAVAKTLTVAEFGRYALITSLLVSLSKVMDFGTNSYFVSKSLMTDENTKDVFLSLKIILFIVSVPVSLLVLLLLKIPSWEYYFVFILGLLAYGLNLTLFAIFQLFQKFNYAVALNTLPSIIKVVFAVLVFAKIVNMTELYAFYIFALSTFGSCIFLYAIPQKYKSFNLSVKNIWCFFRASSPAGISLFINNGLPAVSNSIAKLTKTYTDVGIFSLADKVANVFTLISLSVFTVLLPKNSQRKKDNLTFDFKETYIIGGGILALSFAAIMIAPAFVKVVFQEKFIDSIALLNILIFASGISAIHTFMDNYFFVEGKINTILVISVLKLLTLIVSSLLLIPLFSLQGLAYSQLIASLSAFVLTVVLIKHNVRKNF